MSDFPPTIETPGQSTRLAGGFFFIDPDSAPRMDHCPARPSSGSWLQFYAVGPAAGHRHRVSQSALPSDTGRIGRTSSTSAAPLQQGTRQGGAIHWAWCDVTGWRCRNQERRPVAIGQAPAGRLLEDPRDDVQQRRCLSTAQSVRRERSLSYSPGVSNVRNGSTTDSRDLPLLRPKLGDKRT